MTSFVKIDYLGHSGDWSLIVTLLASSIGRIKGIKIVDLINLLSPGPYH